MPYKIYNLICQDKINYINRIKIYKVHTITAYNRDNAHFFGVSLLSACSFLSYFLSVFAFSVIIKMEATISMTRSNRQA